MTHPLALALLLSGCAHFMPKEPQQCITPARMFGVGVDCAALAEHEQLADAAFKRHTGASLASLAGWTVERRLDVTWSEKHGRLVFTDVRCREGWVLWGCALRPVKTIYIADENFGSAALAHEFCHALFPVADHGPDWERLGCNAVEAEVREVMGPALRVATP